jgi:hypothetical protein
MNFTKAELKELILVRETVGDNTNNNPYREVIKVFGKDGELVAQRDGMYPYSQAEMISFVTSRHPKESTRKVTFRNYSMRGR